MKRYIYLIEKEIENGQSVRQLARKMKITPTSIIDYREGVEPRLAALEKMAAYFHVSMMSLLLDVDDDNYDGRIISILQRLSREKKKQVLQFMESL